MNEENSDNITNRSNTLEINLNASWDAQSSDKTNRNLTPNTKLDSANSLQQPKVPLFNVTTKEESLLPEGNEKENEEIENIKFDPNILVNKMSKNAIFPAADFIGKAIENMLAKKLLIECYKKAEYNVQFNYSYFFKYFLIHFLHYLILGPFLLIVLIPAMGCGAVRNMSFTGTNAGSLIQNGMWFFYVIVIIIYIFFPDEEVSTTFVIILTLSSFFRVFIVSIRYGYTSPIRIKIMTNSAISGELVTSEFIIAGWIFLTPTIIYDELKAAMWRTKIQPFDVSFSHLLSEEWKQRLTNAKYYIENSYNFNKLKTELKKMKRLSMHSDNQVQREGITKTGTFDVGQISCNSLICPKKPFLKLIGNDNMKEYKSRYSGLLFARELYLEGKLRAKTYLSSMMLISLIHCILPFVWNIYMKQTVFGETTGQIIVIICHTILSIVLFSVNVMNLAGSEFDLQRKNEICELLSKICEWEREDKDWIPSLNILDPMQLINWYKLRRIILDAGKKFYVRGIAYNSLFIIMISPLFLLFVLIYFGILNASFPDYWIVALFDILFFLSRVYYIIYLAAKVNDQFSKHKNMLMKTKLNLSILKSKFHLIIQQKEEGLPVQKMLNEDSYLRQFISEFGYDVDKAAYLDLIIDQIYHIVEALEMDEERDPIKFLGFKPTFDFLKGSYWTLITLVFIVVNKELGLM